MLIFLSGLRGCPRSDDLPPAYVFVCPEISGAQRCRIRERIYTVIRTLSCVDLHDDLTGICFYCLPICAPVEFSSMLVLIEFLFRAWPPRGQKEFFPTTPPYTPDSRNRGAIGSLYPLRPCNPPYKKRGPCRKPPYTPFLFFPIQKSLPEKNLGR